jgi:hypothetical protein
VILPALAAVWLVVATAVAFEAIPLASAAAHTAEIAMAFLRFLFTMPAFCSSRHDRRRK